MDTLLFIIAFNMTIQTLMAGFLLYHHYNYKATQSRFIKDTLNQFVDIIGVLEKNIGNEYKNVLTRLGIFNQKLQAGS